MTVNELKQWLQNMPEDSKLLIKLYDSKESQILDLVEIAYSGSTHITEISTAKFSQG